MASIFFCFVTIVKRSRGFKSPETAHSLLAVAVTTFEKSHPEKWLPSIFSTEAFFMPVAFLVIQTEHVFYQLRTRSQLFDVIFKKC
jgi:hypothetical protein